MLHNKQPKKQIEKELSVRNHVKENWVDIIGTARVDNTRITHPITRSTEQKAYYQGAMYRRRRNEERTATDSERACHRHGRVTFPIPRAFWAEIIATLIREIDSQGKERLKDK